MKKGLLTFVMLILSTISFSQVYDNFEDGDLTNNPEWNGNQERFKINSNFQLQLNHPGETNSAYLSTINQIMDSVSWSFFVKLSFSPSANNNLKVYLVSNQSNLGADLEGYYLQFGEAGTSDAIELFKQNGGEHISICRGEEGRIASSFSVRIRVVHKQGNWVVYSDFDDIGNYTIECQAYDDSYDVASYFGFLCKYTSSNATKFYFDDIAIKYVEVDQTVPKVESVSVIENNKLKILFSEAVTKETAEQTSNYEVNLNVGKPTNASLDASQKEVVLDFQNAFEEDIAYGIQISGIKDLVNNIMNDTTVGFKRTELKAFDVIINEIMADPTPAVHLPDAEYLEIYNRTGNHIDLSDWILQIGTSEKVFPEVGIPPGGYLILCKSSNVYLLSSYGTCIGFSSFSLTNAGTQLILKNKFSAIIHELTYTDDWFQDDDKADGGWSLERIDPETYCQEEGNWQESVDERGGSPGAINSINSVIGEPEELSISSIQIIDANHIRLTFNAKMDSLSYGNTLFYDIDNGIGQPIERVMEAPKYNSISFLLSEDLQKDIIYTIETLEGITACGGYDASGLTARFAIPKDIEKGDIVFNEILFDAAIDDGEYIELVNISDKVLDISSLEISRLKINQYDTTWYTMSLSGNLFFPNDYIAYTSSASQVEKVYFSENPERIIDLDDFISLPNSEGQLILHRNTSKDSVIDRLYYSEDWHYSLLNYTKGVSLEKMDLFGANVQENWHSAASDVNYGTPAYQNSQFQEAGETNSKFELSPEIFSPDNDGYDDVLHINYKMEEAGFTLNLIIYDSRGRKIKHLVKNELLSTSGSFYWDGETDDYQKAPIGIYILYFEYFNLNGQVLSEKLTTVLGGKL